MEQRKEFILDQAGKLYQRYGIRNVTMDDVARELGISKKTLYQYFTDKEELVSQFVDSYFIDNPQFRLPSDEKFNAIDRILHVRSQLIKMLKLVKNNLESDLKKSYPKVYRKVIQFKRKRMYEDNFSVMEQGKREGLFRNELDSDLISRMAVGRFLLIFNPDNGIFTEEETRDIHLFDRVVDYHFHGICTEQGLKYFKQQLNNVQNEN